MKKIYMIELIVILGIFMVALWVDKLADEETTVETYVLENVRYQEQITGDFTLGHGTVSSEGYYVCEYMLEDESIGSIWLPENKTVRYKTLDACEKAYVEITRNGINKYKSIKLYLPKDI